MAIYSGNLLTINGKNITGLSGYSVQYNKLWANSERNMNGDVSATLIGVFPKLLLEFRDGLTEDEVGAISKILCQSYFPATYFSPKNQGTVTANYYAGDFETPLLDKARGLYQTFTVNLIPVSKEA